MTRRALTAAAALMLAMACRAPAPSVHGSADARTLVAVPVDGYDAVLAEMRVMLGSLNGAVAGLAAGDVEAVRAAAAASGTPEAADAALEALLPPQWMVLAERVHGGFDTLAAMAARAAPRDSLLGQLGAILPNCVSCHGAYRLGAQ